MPIRKIVIGTDFSAEAEPAFDHGVHIARHTGAELVIVHASALIDAPHELAVQSEWKEYLAAETKARHDKLHELFERVRGQGVNVSHMMIDEAPSRGVIRAAAELGADLTIVGTHGRTGLKRFLIGSEAERIVRASDNAVMVARSQPQTRGYQRVMVPTDFSKAAEAALGVALELAAADAKIEVFHFWNNPLYGPLPDPAVLGSQLQQSAASRGAALLDRFATDRAALTFAAVEGAPRYAISSQLEASSYDLVVMGSHGRRGPSRWLLGSVAEATARHAPCSVVIVKPTAD